MAATIFHTVKNYVRSIERLRGAGKTELVTREHDGLAVEMLAPLHPQGFFLPIVPVSRCPPPIYSTEIVRKGHVKARGYKALDADMLIERNVTIPLRDDIKIYADIFRPPGDSDKVPIIVAWSPYGKHGNNNTILVNLPERVGLPKDAHTGYEDFEGPDPGFWVPRGYAVVNIDIRGSWNSEGDLYWWGRQEARDGYDTIEWLAQLPWTTGKVGMAGNSWLAMSQWFIAAARPPHLAAIAPWEGASDIYRDTNCRGGIPELAMTDTIPLIIPSKGRIEDASKMSTLHPLVDDYWKDKIADLAKIEVPAYILASYTTKLHCAGSFRAFRTISSEKKWIRVHPWQEWYDFGKSEPDLARFFDRYLKGIDNDWEQTPPVRLSLIRFNGADIVNRPLSAYPPSETTQQVYYLDAAHSRGGANAPSNASSICYSGGDVVNIDIEFTTYTELAGYALAKLFLQSSDDDMDVHIMLRKRDRNGKLLERLNFPTSTPIEQVTPSNVVKYKGVTGMIRASHRRIDTTVPTAPGEVFHPHDREEKLKPGEIVPLTIGTWPVGMVFEAGESLCLSISTYCLAHPELPNMRTGPSNFSRVHTLHTGGEHLSYLELPVLEISHQSPSVV